MIRNQIRNRFWNSNNIKIKDLKSEIKSDVPNSNRKLIGNSIRNQIRNQLWNSNNIKIKDLKSGIKSDVPNSNRKLIGHCFRFEFRTSDLISNFKSLIFILFEFQNWFLI